MSRRLEVGSVVGGGAGIDSTPALQVHGDKGHRKQTRDRQHSRYTGTGSHHHRHSSSTPSAHKLIHKRTLSSITLGGSTASAASTSSRQHGTGYWVGEELGGHGGNTILELVTELVEGNAVRDVEGGRGTSGEGEENGGLIVVDEIELSSPNRQDPIAHDDGDGEDTGTHPNGTQSTLKRWFSVSRTGAKKSYPSSPTSPSSIPPNSETSHPNLGTSQPPSANPTASLTRSSQPIPGPASNTHTSTTATLETIMDLESEPEARRTHRDNNHVHFSPSSPSQSQSQSRSLTRSTFTRSRSRSHSPSPSRLASPSNSRSRSLSPTSRSARSGRSGRTATTARSPPPSSLSRSLTTTRLMIIRKILIIVALTLGLWTPYTVYMIA
ncbi:hypothetical protein HK102_007328, partial [Quaeritorhiza haematococci]